MVTKAFKESKQILVVQQFDTLHVPCFKYYFLRYKHNIVAHQLDTLHTGLVVIHTHVTNQQNINKILFEFSCTMIHGIKVFYNV